MDHSIIPASSAYIWGKPKGCTGWALMSNQYPETEQPVDAMEGEASHEIAANLVTAGTNGGVNQPTRENTVDTLASNGILLTDEMFDCAEIYANHVISIMHKTRIYGGPEMGIETRVDSKLIHDLSFGTPDFWLFDRKNYVLYLPDYKFGHDMVEVFEIWQLIVYACGILEKLKINGIGDQHVTVHFEIVQPRAFHRDGIIRKWIVNAADLRGYFNTLNNNAAEALGSNPVTRSGSHCKHCTARHACSAALQGGFSLYEVAKQPTPVELPPDALGVQLAIVKRAIKQLECIETGLSAHAEGLLRSGKLVQGWTMESSKGREEWVYPVNEIISLGDALNIDLRKPDAVCTPKQARAKGLTNELVKQFSKSKQTGLTLTPDNGNKAKRLFNHD